MHGVRSTCVCVRVRVCPRVRVDGCVCVCTHTHACACMRMHAHACACKPDGRRTSDGEVGVGGIGAHAKLDERVTATCPAHPVCRAALGSLRRRKLVEVHVAVTIRLVSDDGTAGWLGWVRDACLHARRSDCEGSLGEALCRMRNRLLPSTACAADAASCAEDVGAVDRLDDSGREGALEETRIDGVGACGRRERGPRDWPRYEAPCAWSTERHPIAVPCVDTHRCDLKVLGRVDDLSIAWRIPAWHGRCCSGEGAQRRHTPTSAKTTGLCTCTCTCTCHAPHGQERAHVMMLGTLLRSNRHACMHACIYPWNDFLYSPPLAPPKDW